MLQVFNANILKRTIILQNIVRYLIKLFFSSDFNVRGKGV